MFAYSSKLNYRLLNCAVRLRARNRTRCYTRAFGSKAAVNQPEKAQQQQDAKERKYADNPLRAACSTPRSRWGKQPGQEIAKEVHAGSIGKLALDR